MASAVTYEMVEDVCNHLAAGGESPTYLKVHQRLGKGSTRIVSAYIRQWREAQVLSQALERDPLFGEWPEALQLKARSLFDGLLALSAEAANASAESQRLSFEERERVLAAKVSDTAPSVRYWLYMVLVIFWDGLNETTTLSVPPPCGRASKVLLDTNFMPS